jgi:hypothetical protein
MRMLQVRRRRSSWPSSRQRCTMLLQRERQWRERRCPQRSRTWTARWWCASAPLVLRAYTQSAAHLPYASRPHTKEGGVHRMTERRMTSCHCPQQPSQRWPYPTRPSPPEGSAGREGGRMFVTDWLFFPFFQSSRLHEGQCMLQCESISRAVHWHRERAVRSAAQHVQGQVKAHSPEREPQRQSRASARRCGTS